MKYIAIRKEPNGLLYMDKYFFNRYNDSDLGRYSYKKVEIPDEYFDTFTSQDFNYDLKFNETKYLERVEKEKADMELMEYEDAIVSLIRHKYNLNQELAILRQRDVKPEEFSKYNAYVEQCKQEVKNSLTTNL